MYDYRAQANRIIGPLTIEVTIELGFNITHKTLIRLDGITQPERAKRAEAIHLVTKWLGKHETFTLQSFRSPRERQIDRWLGRIKGADGTMLHGELLAAGLVQPQTSGLYPEDEDTT